MGKKQTWKTAVKLGLGAAALFVFARWVLPVLLPFLLGLAVAALAGKPIAFLRDKAGLPRWLASFLCVLGIFVLFGGGLYLLGKTVLTELGDFLRALPRLLASLAQPVSRLKDRLLALADKFPDGIGSGLRAGLLSVFENSSLLSTRVYDWLFAFASGLLSKAPGILMFTVTSVAASFLSASELPELRRWADRKLPNPWRQRLSTLSGRLKQTLGGWLRAQGKLMLVTFLILTAGFLLLRQDYPLLLALVITLVDALPILGTGTVLIPWALVRFLQRDVSCGVGLLVLYGAAALTRQSLEPRLVGRQIGLNPLMTLLALYLGYRLIGILGMFVFPIGVIFLKQLWESVGENGT